MKKYFISLLSLLPFFVMAQRDLKLWYQQPANRWTEALPIGNGRLGAMIFGNSSDELIQLNESTLWSGGPVSASVNPSASQYLPQVRQAIAEGDYKKASELCQKMQGLYTESYLPLGDLLIRQEFKSGSSPTNYYRDLNISDAVATTKFQVGNVQYTREMFSSAADQVIVIRLKADKAGSLNLKIAARSPLKYQNLVIEKNVLAWARSFLLMKCRPTSDLIMKKLNTPPLTSVVLIKPRVCVNHTNHAQAQMRRIKLKLLRKINLFLYTKRWSLLTLHKKR